MSVTLFISDLHLSPENPAMTDCFIRFLNREASRTDALYILGDFFEAWIGDDAQNPFTDTITGALKNWPKPLCLMVGNRDFLMGEVFAKKVNATLLSDPTVIDLYGTPTLITHGDLLCQDDKEYLKYRKIVHQKWLQKLFLWLPLRFREKIALKMRQESSKYVKQASAASMDVTPSAVKDWLSIYKASRIIHGHTHRPVIYPERIVLPAWHERGGALVVGPDKPPELVFFE
ncbi:MAG: UDP-2,3-diacylglucosamine diphosphatase [Gammaproteobacteria bacterium]|nr:UDP-2,3-diacylglucosamine diphosphatase [Gammaproteobacteria bacterium]